ncbi:peptidase family c50 protein, partial [Toxoplasma gondii TgCatPRC2]
MDENHDPPSAERPREAEEVSPSPVESPKPAHGMRRQKRARGEEVETDREDKTLRKKCRPSSTSSASLLHTEAAFREPETTSSAAQILCLVLRVSLAYLENELPSSANARSPLSSSSPLSLSSSSSSSLSSSSSSSSEIRLQACLSVLLLALSGLNLLLHLPRPRPRLSPEASSSSAFSSVSSLLSPSSLSPLELPRLSAFSLQSSRPAGVLPGEAQPARVVPSSLRRPRETPRGEQREESKAEANRNETTIWTSSYRASLRILQFASRVLSSSRSGGVTGRWIAGARQGELVGVSLVLSRRLLDRLLSHLVCRISAACATNAQTVKHPSHSLPREHAAGVAHLASVSASSSSSCSPPSPSSWESSLLSVAALLRGETGFCGSLADSLGLSVRFHLAIVALSLDSEAADGGRPVDGDENGDKPGKPESVERSNSRVVGRPEATDFARCHARGGASSAVEARSTESEDTKKRREGNAEIGALSLACQGLLDMPWEALTGALLLGRLFQKRTLKEHGEETSREHTANRPLDARVENANDPEKPDTEPPGAASLPVLSSTSAPLACLSFSLIAPLSSHFLLVFRPGEDPHLLARIGLQGMRRTLLAWLRSGVWTAAFAEEAVQRGPKEVEALLHHCKQFAKLAVSLERPRTDKSEDERRGARREATRDLSSAAFDSVDDLLLVCSELTSVFASSSSMASPSADCDRSSPSVSSPCLPPSQFLVAVAPFDACAGLILADGHPSFSSSFSSRSSSSFSSLSSTRTRCLHSAEGEGACVRKRCDSNGEEPGEKAESENAGDARGEKSKDAKRVRQAAELVCLAFRLRHQVARSLALCLERTTKGKELEHRGNDRADEMSSDKQGDKRAEKRAEKGERRTEPSRARGVQEELQSRREASIVLREESPRHTEESIREILAMCRLDAFLCTLTWRLAPFLIHIPSLSSSLSSSSGAFVSFPSFASAASRSSSSSSYPSSFSISASASLSPFESWIASAEFNANSLGRHLELLLSCIRPSSPHSRLPSSLPSSVSSCAPAPLASSSRSSSVASWIGQEAANFGEEIEDLCEAVAQASSGWCQVFLPSLLSASDGPPREVGNRVETLRERGGAKPRLPGDDAEADGDRRREGKDELTDNRRLLSSTERLVASTFRVLLRSAQTVFLFSEWIRTASATMDSSSPSFASSACCLGPSRSGGASPFSVSASSLSSSSAAASPSLPPFGFSFSTPRPCTGRGCFPQLGRARMRLERLVASLVRGRRKGNEEAEAEAKDAAWGKREASPFCFEGGSALRASFALLRLFTRLAIDSNLQRLQSKTTKSPLNRRCRSALAADADAVKPADAQKVAKPVVATDAPRSREGGGLKSDEENEDASPVATEDESEKT